MEPRHLGPEICADYRLWRDYADPDGLWTKEEFDRTSEDELRAIYLDCWPDLEWEFDPRLTDYDRARRGTDCEQCGYPADVVTGDDVALCGPCALHTN